MSHDGNAPAGNPVTTVDGQPVIALQWPTLTVSRHAIAMFMVFCAGALLNAFAYESAAPTVAAVLIYAAGRLVIRVTGANAEPERRAFQSVFSMAWLMAGIAAIYANSFHDPGQSINDAGVFYDIAAHHASDASLAELRLISDGAGALVVWRTAYEFFSSLGFERGRYIGILVNILAVTLSSVLGLRITRLVYGSNEARLRRVGLFCAGSGIMWLFAALHVRDSLILLCVTVLTYAWVRCLTRPGIANLWLAGGASAGFFAVIAFLRAEFFFVPVAMGASAVAGIMFAGQRPRGARMAMHVLVFASLVFAVVGFLKFQSAITLVLTEGAASYKGIAPESSSASSLGLRLIVNAPMPIRIVLGSVYLYIFPIPVWTGFQLKSAYELFKSCQALFFIIVLPLSLMALLQVMRKKAERTPALVFLAVVQLGMTVAIAATSLETRHLGAFFVPCFVLAALPDLTQPWVWARYCRNEQRFVAAIAGVHVLWFVLKTF